MCGVIGAVGTDVTAEQLEVIRKAMKESRIRGKHASGIAWSNGREVKVFTQPKPIDELAAKLNWEKIMYGERQICLIAHARYSTSDIRYNQPLKGRSLAMVHNGVVSQADPSKWKSLYGLECETANDSELLVRCIENDERISEKFPTSSIACCMIDGSGNLRAYRNGLRPLWKSQWDNLTLYASTKDILRRAGAPTPEKLEADGEIEWQNRSVK